MNRRVMALVVGVALPTVLLGVGWLTASLREGAALRREQEHLLARTADAVRGAVDESLEELRRREDRRPFYLYDLLYSPPDVLALNDPVAASPLSKSPDDVRVIGYFQIEPGGAVRTPYALNDADLERSARGQRVVQLVGSPSFAELRNLTSAVDVMSNAMLSSPLLASVRPATDRATQADPSAQPEDLRPRKARQNRRPRNLKSAAEVPAELPTELPTPAQPGETAASAVVKNITNPSQAELAPQGPLTTNLSQWNRDVLNDIQQAQAGDPDANYRVQTRGRAAPRTRRNTVAWDEMNAQSQASEHQRSVKSSSPRAQQAKATAPRRRSRPSRRAPPAPPALPAAVQPALPDQTEIEVDYTPMAWGIMSDGAVVLHRVVSHEGTAVVQGVILDRHHIIERWIPSLVRRHVVSSSLPTVITRGQDAECAIRRPASELLEGIELCYSFAAVQLATAHVQDDLRLQLAALAGLVMIVTLAGLAMYRSTTRAEELSAQKSAFVSSVSHELRTPLTTIRMHAEMLRDGLVPEAKRDRFHRQLVQESVRLSNLVENVLELSRLEEGRRVLKPQLADLRAAVAAVIADQQPFVEEKGFELKGPTDGDPVTLPFDAQAVSQIVVNLVDNSVKYGAGQTLVIEADVVREGDGGLIVVRDHGPGVPEDQQERVFERFHRLRDLEMEHLPGTGIGLSLVRELARAHGGDAEVRRAEGGGCEVRVMFTGGDASGNLKVS